jgi:hypothetical protein
MLVGLRSCYEWRKRLQATKRYIVGKCNNSHHFCQKPHVTVSYFITVQQSISKVSKVGTFHVQSLFIRLLEDTSVLEQNICATQSCFTTANVLRLVNDAFDRFGKFSMILW